MIIFENEGEIDAVSICTFGVNVKTQDSAIGYFGTGLKYAIAVLLRLEHSITIYSGTTKHVFSVQERDVRGKRFDIVCMDGQPLGFTTELGKNWQLWQAFRELYCNAVDELGGFRQVRKVPKPRQGHTLVVVEGAAFEQLAQHELDSIVLPKAERNLVQDMGVSIRDFNGHNHLYYQGIRALEDMPSPRFTYNLLRQQTLTEDRTLKDMYAARAAIAKAIITCDNKHVIQKCITSQDGFEYSLDYHWPGTTPSQAFLEVVDECRKQRIPVCSSAAQMMRDHTPRLKHSKELDLSKVQSQMLKRAVAFCKKMRFAVDEYPIVVMDAIDDGVLGLAKDNTIFLAERVFAQGTKQVASTLIEEFLHLKHGLEDESREMQTYLFDCIVSLGEEMQGRPL